MRKHAKDKPIVKIGRSLASVALAMGIASSKATCFAVYHQPKVPQGMSKFVREK